jgi:hypothetical protein
MYIYYASGSPLMQKIELCLLTSAIAASFLWSSGARPDLQASGFFPSLERSFARLSQKKSMSAAMLGLFVLAFRVSLIPLLGLPQPKAHDEFSYLLAADTFAHGRMTNPPHPLWTHFESFHIIQQPTYMSMYPPAQGLTLAAGEVLGHPWIGELLITAIMCSATVWMLQGWFPSAWALFGAFLLVLRVVFLSYWMDGYWSTSVVALGGLLVLGAMPRLKRRLRTRDAVWLALGLVILANSRPYEGLVLGLTVALGLLPWLFGAKHPSFSVLLRRLVIPVMAILLISAFATAFYYYRVTGNPSRMAYEINRDTYSRARYFVWQPRGAEVSYHHAVMRDFYGAEFEYYQWARTTGGFLRTRLRRASLLWRFYLGPVLTMPLVVLPCIIGDRKMRFPLIATVVFLLALTVEIWIFPHYFAPAVGLLLIILVQCLRHLAQWRWHRRSVGRALVRSVFLVCCMIVILRLTAAAVRIQLELPWPRGDLARARILRDLENTPGRHLIIVQYSDMHDPDREWVYNRADIDRARTVWARDMGEDENERLIRYFSDRKIWLLMADHAVPVLQPYQSPLRH